MFPNTLIAAQLQTVAKIMSIRAALGIGRQIFFCQLGGFDTHGAQLGTQDPLLQQLSQGRGRFLHHRAQRGGDGSEYGHLHGLRI